MLEEFLHQSRIAYFSMEIALQDDIPTHSGGLGVLVGIWPEGRIWRITGCAIGKNARVAAAANSRR